MPGTIQELLKDNEFKFEPKRTPTYNYITFQQAISFQHGVEFLATSNFSNKPMLVLLDIPVLSINLVQSKKILTDFNQKLLDQLNSVIDKAMNLFDMFMHFYELYRAVLLKHEDYKHSKENFFSVASAVQFNIIDVKKLKLPFVQTYYKSVFQDRFRTGHQPINFDDIGVAGKRHLEKLYLLKRRYNTELVKNLELFKKQLFENKTLTSQYKYNGEIADILEIAGALFRSGNLTVLNKRAISQLQIAKDLASFLGRTFSTIGANKSSLDKRKAFKDTFFHKSIRNA